MRPGEGRIADDRTLGRARTVRNTLVRPRILQCVHPLGEVEQQAAGLSRRHLGRIERQLSNGIAPGENRALLGWTGDSPRGWVVMSFDQGGAFLVICKARIRSNELDELHVAGIDSLINAREPLF